ncbi:hypothetical protein DPMN_105987 [Dreissena polymorpha]|uniref:Uncharacterized protein n=1 Tax=Dreissena polymorpha TaxID=45954 RepID=A0A9D4QIA5_DREPO|nr:hypothetical protein DPMN_105987 [Dreissena polymorpha]
MHVPTTYAFVYTSLPEQQQHQFTNKSTALREGGCGGVGVGGRARGMVWVRNYDKKTSKNIVGIKGSDVCKVDEICPLLRLHYMRTRNVSSYLIQWEQWCSSRKLFVFIVVVVFDHRS